METNAELDRMPAQMVAEMMSGRLGFLVTPEQVYADRAQRGVGQTTREGAPERAPAPAPTDARSES